MGVTFRLAKGPGDEGGLEGARERHKWALAAGEKRKEKTIIHLSYYRAAVQNGLMTYGATGRFCFLGGYSKNKGAS